MEQLDAELQEQIERYQEIVENEQRIITPEQFNNTDGLSMRVFLTETWRECCGLYNDNDKTGNLLNDDYDYIIGFVEVIAMSIQNRMMGQCSLAQSLRSPDDDIKSICKAQRILKQLEEVTE